MRIKNRRMARASVGLSLWSWWMPTTSINLSCAWCACGQPGTRDHALKCGSRSGYRRGHDAILTAVGRCLRTCGIPAQLEFTLDQDAGKLRPDVWIGTHNMFLQETTRALTAVEAETKRAATEARAVAKAAQAAKHKKYAKLIKGKPLGARGRRLRRQVAGFREVLPPPRFVVEERKLQAHVGRAEPVSPPATGH